MEVATVTSKSMVTIPSRIRKKYKIKQGAKIGFVDEEGGILMIPLLSLPKLFGVDQGYKELLFEAVRELEREHRREAEE